MKTIGNHPARAELSRLRFLFGETVVTRGLSANATFEDIAQTLGKLSKRRYGSPIAIHVTFDPAPPAGLLH